MAQQKNSNGIFIEGVFPCTGHLLAGANCGLC